MFLLLGGVLITLFVLNYISKNQDIVQPFVFQIATKKIKINDIIIPVELADTDQKRSEGLSDRTELKQDSGMLFVFNSNGKTPFWMKDMKFSIDIIWINEAKTIVGIDKDAQPQPGTADQDLKRYYPPEEVKYVLEVNAGFSDKNNLKVGDSVDLSSI